MVSPTFWLLRRHTSYVQFILSFQASFPGIENFSIPVDSGLCKRFIRPTVHPPTNSFKMVFGINNPLPSTMGSTQLPSTYMLEGI